MFYFVTLLILIGIVSFATYYVINEPGYIVLQWDVWQVELSLAFGIVALVLVVLILFIGLEVLAGFIRIPGRLGRSYRTYRGQKKYATSVKGLQLLLLGDWNKAEQLLDKSAAHLPEPAVNYLAAAYAAQKQNKFVQRNRYLKKARDLGKQDQALVSLFACRLLMEQGEYRDAIEGLKKLCAKLPRNAQAFAMLAKAYEQTEDWDALNLLLPYLKRNKAATADELNALTAKVVIQRLRSVDRSATLQSIWKNTPNPVQRDPEVLATYVRKLLEFNCHQEVDKVIRTALNRNWDSELAYLYGLVKGHLKDQRLYDNVQSWLQNHSEDPDLLLTAGKLARRLGESSKAQIHLKKSIDLGARRDAYEELGTLLEEMGRTDEAISVYKTGILMPQQRKQQQAVIVVQEVEPDGYSESDENSKES